MVETILKQVNLRKEPLEDINSTFSKSGAKVEQKWSKIYDNINFTFSKTFSEAKSKRTLYI